MNFGQNVMRDLILTVKEILPDSKVSFRKPKLEIWHWNFFLEIIIVNAFHFIPWLTIQYQCLSHWELFCGRPGWFRISIFQRVGNFLRGGKKMKAKNYLKRPFGELKRPELMIFSLFKNFEIFFFSEENIRKVFLSKFFFEKLFFREIFLLIISSSFSPVILRY